MADTENNKWFAVALVFLGALLAIPGAIIATDLSTKGESSGQPSPTQSVQSYTSAPVSPSPSPSQSETNPARSPSSSPGPSPRNTPRPRPILVPVNQSGYRPIWHGSLTIGYAGVIFNPTGPPQPGTGITSNMQYQGKDSEMNEAGDLFYWTIRTVPGPASCFGADTSPEVVVVTAPPHAGDRYCYIASGSLPPVIAYMQVTSVGDGGVNTRAWLWYQNG